MIRVFASVLLAGTAILGGVDPGAAAGTGPFAADAGTYVGLAGSEAPSFAKAGSFRIRVDDSGAFSGTLALGEGKYRLRGLLGVDGSITDLAVARRGAPTQSVSLSLDRGEGEEDLHGQAVAGGPASILHGSRLLHTARADPPPPLRNLPEGWAGVYALRIHVPVPPGGENGPLGDSWATVKVLPSGKVVVSGLLPDGTRFRARSFVLVDGAVPIHVPLHRGRGAIRGWLSIPSGVTEDHRWFRPADPADDRFPDGWPGGIGVDFGITPGAPDLRRLTVLRSGSGDGRVTSDPPGIDLGDVGTALFPAGTVVTLAAAPAAGSLFDGWSGDGSGSGTRTVVLDGDAKVTAAFVVDPFEVDIDLADGLVRFPNVWSGWTVGGSPLSNYVAYPSGWSAGGGSATNYVALPPGWSLGGGPATNYTAVPPGWSVGGGAATNFVAVPPGWSVGGGPATNFVALPPGWTAGGGAATNFTALPPGWSAGGGSATNFVALPPGWAAGGGSATNFFGYPVGKGWTTGGGSLTNLTGLAPGWSAGGGSTSNFVAMPAGWVAGGGSATGFVTYPGGSVTTIELKFDDPGWLACLQVLQDSGAYTERQLGEIALAAFLNLRKTAHFRSVPTEAASGDW